MKVLLTRITIFLFALLVTIHAQAQEKTVEVDVATNSQTTDLSGVWVQKMVLTAVSKPPVVSKVTTETITYLRIEIEQKSAADIRMTATVCDVDINSDFKRLRTIVSSGFIKALGTTLRTAKIVQSDGKSFLEVAQNVQVIGAALREPGSEILPTQSDDFRVTDQDKDGKPGVTVRIEGLINGDIYVVQRGKDSYRGLIDANDLIRGEVRWENEQVVLGSTSMFLGNVPPTWVHKDPARSYFEMKRLKENLSCAQIKANKDKLFP